MFRTNPLIRDIYEKKIIGKIEKEGIIDIICDICNRPNVTPSPLNSERPFNRGDRKEQNKVPHVPIVPHVPHYVSGHAQKTP